MSVIQPMASWIGVFFVVTPKRLPEVVYTPMQMNKTPDEEYIHVVARPLLGWHLPPTGHVAEALYYWEEKRRPATALEICAVELPTIQHHLGDFIPSSGTETEMIKAVLLRMKGLLALHEENQICLFLSKQAREFLNLFE